MRTESADLVVVGAGPAGLAAATEGARAGLDVILVDENASPGGQIWRSLPEEFDRDTRERAKDPRGRTLIDTLASLPVRRFFKTSVWGAFSDRQLEASGPSGPFRIKAPSIILAVGAHDRPVALPGWTLPGVMTVGGGQVLLKGQRSLPGRRVVLAGTGPLLLVVAAQYARAGAEIVAVLESASSLSLLRHAPALLGAPALMLQGASYKLSLLLRSVPWHASTLLSSIEGREGVEAVVASRLDAQGSRVAGSDQRIACDLVLMGYGLVPSLELPRLLGCALRFDELRQSFVPERTEDLETSVPGVFMAGDGAGVAGAVVAVEEGRLAALAVARALGRLSEDEARSRQETSRGRLAGLGAFRRAMDEVYAPPAILATLAQDDTVVCRCEDVTLADVRSAIADGAREAAQVKLWTRAGMGPCQGRMCHAGVAGALCRSTGRSLKDIGPYSVRAPVKPLDVETLLRID